MAAKKKAYFFFFVAHVVVAVLVNDFFFTRRSTHHADSVASRSRLDETLTKQAIIEEQAMVDRSRSDGWHCVRAELVAIGTTSDRREHSAQRKVKTLTPVRIAHCGKRSLRAAHTRAAETIAASRDVTSELQQRGGRQRRRPIGVVEGIPLIT